MALPPDGCVAPMRLAARGRQFLPIPPSGSPDVTWEGISPRI